MLINPAFDLWIDDGNPHWTAISPNHWIGGVCFASDQIGGFYPGECEGFAFE